MKTLRERAYALLARREYARRELSRRLSAYAEADEIEALLDELQAANLLSEQRYAEMLLHARSGRHGSRRLTAELKEKGVPAEIAADALAQARATDLEACREVWQKRFGVAPVDAKDRARQMRFLLGRGFPAGVVSRVMSLGVDELISAEA